MPNTIMDSHIRKVGATYPGGGADLRNYLPTRNTEDKRRAYPGHVRPKPLPVIQETRILYRMMHRLRYIYLMSSARED